MTKLKQHEAGKIFRRLNETERNSLKENIKKNGLLRPISMYEGKILSGYERYLICLELGITPKFETFTNTTITALDFVWAENAERRHLSKQDAIVSALKYKFMIEKDIKANGYKKLSEALIKGERKGRNLDGISYSAGIAGEAFGVTRSMLNKAQNVYRKDPSLFKKIESGELKVEQAYKIANPHHAVKCERVSQKAREEVYENRARKFMQSEELKEFKFPGNIYAPDSEFWSLDNYMKSKGYSLSLSRIGDSFDAIYSKTEARSSLGHTTWKSAVMSASKEALSKEIV